jgi:hypothetical protein
MFGQRKHTPKLRRRSNQQVSTAIAKLNSEKSTSYRRGRFFSTYIWVSSDVKKAKLPYSRQLGLFKIP